MSQEERRRGELESLAGQSSLLNEKIGRLRRALAVETDVTRRFQVEKQLEEAEGERAGVERRMHDLEQGLPGETPPVISKPKAADPVDPVDDKPAVSSPAAAGTPVSLKLLGLATVVVVILMVVSALLLRYVLEIQDGASFILVLLVVLGFVLFVVDRLAGREYLKGLARMVTTFFK